jgi:uncharacterized RDD family membrane protein YckC
MTSPDDTSLGHTRFSSLLRRLASIVYDALVVTAVLLIAAVPVVLLAQETLSAYPGRLLFQAYLLLVVFVFFAGFWVHGGQTLGMRAWRLRLTNTVGGNISWKQATLRFGAALLSWLPAGLGFLWVLLDRDGCAWHDRLSGTRLRRVGKK